jgi:Phage tail lysozyme/Ig-like domain from next to BRCA1 gene
MPISSRRLSSKHLLSAVLALPLLVTGCSGAGTDESVDSRDDQVVSENANDKVAFEFFVGKGLSPVQAAGIVGNLDQESGMSPTISQYGGGPGRGIAQWSAGGRWDSSYHDNVAWYASTHGASIYSLDLQLDFIWYELTTFPGYGLANLQAQTTVSGATNAFMTDFEICGTCDATNRVSYAQAVYDAFGTAEYAATFVSQSFPYATMTMTMTAGQVIPSYIELKNTGTATWDSNTKIGTTQPRDRTSAFADATWVAPNRPARVSGTVAPGGTYKFTFDLAAPMTPGMYDEHFGVVEESVAWFSDPGQGGPPDTQLEVKIQVVAGSSSSSSSSGSTSSGGHDAGAGDAGGGGSGAGGAGTGGSGAGGSGAGGSGSGSTSKGSVGDTSNCAFSAGQDGPYGRLAPWLLGLAIVAGRRARRRFDVA